MEASMPAEKIDVRPEWWDNIFAPSSCLTIITTVDKQGRVNAASYGTCTRVCHDPVYISFTCGTGKDTYDNVLATGEFVVNVVPFEQAMLDKTLVCGLPFKGGINELEKAGLTAIPSRVLRPPRIAECRSHFECKVEWTHPWVYRLMVCGKVEAVSIDADCVTDKVSSSGTGSSRRTIAACATRTASCPPRQADPRGLALRRWRRGIPRRRELARRLPQRGLKTPHRRAASR
jgi:flavin reductase (DIM6/NTAB) family NADH-FMN oxidoreductase RutF